MRKLNVTRTRDLGLCLSCEICSAACPADAIAMEYRAGQFLPRVDDGKCTDCGLCLEICPGVDIDPFELRYKDDADDMFDGPCLQSYTAYSNDPDIRKISTSGGLITTLIIELIRNKEFDAAFVLPFDIFTGKPARLTATKEISEIINSAKSKYIPASVHNVILALGREGDSRYIVVGTPCQIYGIKKFLRRSKIAEENVLFLGLFCDRTLNFNIIRYFEDTYGQSGEELIKFEFRTKERYGWPGNSKVYFDSGRELILDKKVRQQLKPFFQLKRCLFCTDKLNRLADISFGDCYIPGKEDFQGKSSVVVRTEKGKELFAKYSYLFTLERENVEEIRRSQYLIGRKDNLEYAKILIKEHNLYPDTSSDYESNKQVVQRLAKLYRHIKWGQNYNINRVKSFLFLSRVARRVRAAIALGIMGIAILEGLLIRRWGRRRLVPKKAAPGNVVIVGAGLHNKGAQAMLFTTVDQIRRRLPERNIYVLHTRSFELEEAEKSVYNFNILPWYPEIKIGLLSFLASLFRRGDDSKRIENHTRHIREVIKNADFFVDISGYALASSAGLYGSLDYLLNIVIARKFSVPYYILPQSIGPFDYRLSHKILLYPLMRLCLRYPERIFPREEEGVECVSKFMKKNVRKSYDIVLQGKEYNLTNVHGKEVRFRDIRIEPNSVGIIPNYHLIERANPGEIYSVYRALISRLIDAEKTVYILRHADNDLQVCETIKRFFSDNTSVHLVVDDLNCIELESVIRQFDFVIASRYHSIIHSYENGVPAIVIGWATKYLELSKNFDQLDYFFDVRNEIDIDEIGGQLNKLVNNWRHEKEKITSKMNSLIKENIFDIFGEE